MSLDEDQNETPKRPRGRSKARQIVAARLEKLEDLSVSKLVPSTLTLLGLCSGATGIRFALQGDWTDAVAAVVFAMIFDMLDGRAARMLGADTRFGAQLDSLADLVSFGMAPGIIMYSWSLSTHGRCGLGGDVDFLRRQRHPPGPFQCAKRARRRARPRPDPYFTGLPTPRRPA